MTHIYCMTVHRALVKGRARYEDDAGKHFLRRTNADFSKERIHQPNSICLLLMDKRDAAGGQEGLH